MNLLKIGRRVAQQKKIGDIEGLFDNRVRTISLILVDLMLVNLLPVDLILVHWIKLYLCSSLEIFDIRVKTDRDEFIFCSSVMLVLHMLEKVAFVSRAPNSDEDFSESISVYDT